MLGLTGPGAREEIGTSREGIGRQSLWKLMVIGQVCKAMGPQRMQARTQQFVEHRGQRAPSGGLRFVGGSKGQRQDMFCPGNSEGKRGAQGI